MLEATAKVNHILLEEEHIDTALSKALGVIGEATQVDRVYIFENYTDFESGELFCNQKIEWAKDSVAPQIENEELQGFPFQEYTPRWVETLKEGGVINGLVKSFPESERAILEPQDIVSLLVVPIIIKDTFWGFVGFDNCTSEYIWSNQESAVLTSLASNIGLAYERLRTQAQLEESKRMFEQITGAIDEVVFLRNADMSLLYMNDAFERMFGISVENLKKDSRLFTSKIHPDDLHKLQKALEAEDDEFELRYLDADDNVRYIANKRFPVKDEQGNVIRYVGVMNDVTKEREAEEKLKVALSQEKELNDLKNRFISMISHEIRTPVTAIVSSAELFKTHYDRLTSEKKSELNNRIINASGKIVALLEQVLLMGKSDAGKLVAEYSLVDLEQLATEVVAEMKEGSLKDHEVDLTFGMSRHGIEIDQNLMRHVLSNLLENAAKYSEKGSAINLSFKEFGEELNFMVRDEGLGIDEEEIEKIFEPFYRSREVFEIEGTGLGMTIVSRAVEAMRGDISVESEKGKGTSFYVSLPLKN
jgi:PAS domain S-box-containing protein